jgi:hypothetical protein
MAYSRRQQTMIALTSRLTVAGAAVGLLIGLSAAFAWPSVSAAAIGDSDPAALQMLSGADSGSALCGPYRVSWNNTPSRDFSRPGSAMLRATSADGRLTFDLSRPLSGGERVIPLWCGDILGDGSQTLAFEVFSGGAHCCFSATLVQLEPGARHLLDADLGNGGLVQPRQLDSGGPLELPAASDVFAYFGDLSFAASPFLPLVFAYDGTHYVEATSQFPDLVMAELEQADADLLEAVEQPVAANEPPQFAYQEQESVALRLFGLHVLLRDADQGLPGIASRVSKPVAAWLEANAPAAMDALAQRYNLDN